LDPRQNRSFGFGSVSPQKRGFGFKTDPGLIMRRPASQLYVGIAAFDAATRRTRCAGCKRCNALVKVDRMV